MTAELPPLRLRRIARSLVTAGALMVAACEGETRYVDVDDDQVSGAGAGDSASSSGSSGVALAASTSTGAGGSEPVIEPMTFGFSAREVIADRSRDRFYVSVSSDSPEHASSIVVLAADGEILEVVTVGDDPGALALSEDGATLWVGLDGTQQVLPVSLGGDSLAPGDPRDLPQDGADDAPLVAGSMATLRGAPDAVAISLHPRGTRYFVAFVVFDGADAPRNADLGYDLPTHLASGPPGWIFATDESRLFAIDVSATPVIRAAPDLLQNAHDLLAGDGRVYATAGEVLDVTIPDAPRRAGTFPFAPDALTVAGNDAFALSLRDESTVYLRLLRTDTFTQETAVVVPVEPWEVDSAPMAALGRGSVAIVTHGVSAPVRLLLVTDAF